MGDVLEYLNNAPKEVFAAFIGVIGVIVGAVIAACLQFVVGLLNYRFIERPKNQAEREFAFKKEWYFILCQKAEEIISDTEAINRNIRKYSLSQTGINDERIDNKGRDALIEDRRNTFKLFEEQHFWWISNKVLTYFPLAQKNMEVFYDAILAIFMDDDKTETLYNNFQKIQLAKTDLITTIQNELGDAYTVI